MDSWVQLEDRVSPNRLFPTMLGEKLHLFFIQEREITGVQKLIPKETIDTIAILSLQ